MFWEAQTIMEPTTLSMPQLIANFCLWLQANGLPDACANHDGGLSTKHVGEETREQSSNP